MQASFATVRQSWQTLQPMKDGISRKGAKAQRKHAKGSY
jgi:hypothetical protein